MPYLIGNAVTISTTITTGTPAVAVDPSTITLTVTKPDSTVDTFTGGQLTHGGTGAYSYVYFPATTGAYRYVWTTTSPASASDGTFYVAASSQAIVTAADVRTHLNLTDATQDVELQGFISAAQAMVENITGPVLPQVVTETFDGGQVHLVLSEYPVLSIASVVENSQGTTSTLAELAAPYSDTTGLSYRVDYSIGTLTRWSGTMQSRWAAGLGTVTVTYTAGRASVPPDVRLATLRLIEHLWTSQQNSGRLRGGSPDIPAAGHAIPWFVEELLQPHAKAPAIG
jgi:hypothetical protein